MRHVETEFIALNLDSFGALSSLFAMLSELAFSKPRLEMSDIDKSSFSGNKAYNRDEQGCSGYMDILYTALRTT